MNYANNCKLLKPQVFQLFLVPFITEVMDTADLDKVAQVADVIQIGARNRVSAEIRANRDTL
ncbi:hypothetical protein [Nostoc sp. FACHB-892]|uniref:hypothetical protein n=1 Tax=Nostoc sp. FACHB-892 TaxID=2692843 RepID=UPI0024121FAF|nr:hypothetical protein [Nostoc sp. FACHB-892]